MLHTGLPLGGLGAVQRSPIRFGFHTLKGGKESDDIRRRAGRIVGETSDRVGHVRLLEDVLLGLALFRVTTRRDKCRRVVGHVGNKFAEAKEMIPESSLAKCYRKGFGGGEGGVDRIGVG
jgi:hypothetical protein